MDESISAIIGALIFSAFVAGLAESIGAIPFILIVSIVIVLMGIDTIEVVKKALKSKKSHRLSE